MRKPSIWKHVNKKIFYWQCYKTSIYVNKRLKSVLVWFYVYCVYFRCSKLRILSRVSRCVASGDGGLTLHDPTSWRVSQKVEQKLTKTGSWEEVRRSELASDWSRVITWPGYWPLIGPEWSRDLTDTGENKNLGEADTERVNPLQRRKNNPDLFKVAQE